MQRREARSGFPPLERHPSRHRPRSPLLPSFSGRPRDLLTRPIAHPLAATLSCHPYLPAPLRRPLRALPRPAPRTGDIRPCQSNPPLLHCALPRPTPPTRGIRSAHHPPPPTLAPAPFSSLSNVISCPPCLPRWTLHLCRSSRPFSPSTLTRASSFPSRSSCRPWCVLLWRRSRQNLQLTPPLPLPAQIFLSSLTYVQSTRTHTRTTPILPQALNTLFRSPLPSRSFARPQAHPHPNSAPEGPHRHDLRGHQARPPRRHRHRHRLRPLRQLERGGGRGAAKGAGRRHGHVACW